MNLSSHKRPWTRALALLALVPAVLAGGAGLATAETGPIGARPASVAPTPVAPTPAGEMTTEEVLALTSLSAEQREALMQGDIVDVDLVGDSSEGATEAVLYSGLATWVPQPLEHVVPALGEQRETAGGELVLEVPEAGPLPDLPLEPGNVTEVERILSFDGGRKVNLSAEEVASLRSLGVSAPLDADELSRFSQAFRELLEARLARYRREGLPGIAPYTRGDGQAQAVSADLTLVTRRAVHHITRFFPEFCADIERYPNTGLTPHRYLLVRDTWEERPQFILVHSMTDVRSTRAAFLHREFFVSQGYDAMQVLILAVPYRGGTLIYMTTDVVTDQVAGFASSVLQWVGRKRVRKVAEERLARIRAAIEAVGTSAKRGDNSEPEAAQSQTVLTRSAPPLSNP